MGLLESLRNRGGLLGTVGQTLTDYQQLANAYPNASKFAEGLIKNLSAVAPPDPRNQQQSMQYAINRAFDVPGGFGGAIDVWHGSPHKFDAFDMSKIGTGEGAQAYGHGLYFAESPQTAEWYKEKLGGYDADADSQFLSKWYELLPDGDIKKAVGRNDPIDEILSITDNEIEWLSKNYPDDSDIETLSKFAKAYRDGDFDKSYLYKTSLQWPDAAKETSDPLGPQHFLDWDKPLHSQSNLIKDRLPSKIEVARQEFLADIDNPNKAEKLARLRQIQDALAGDRLMTGADVYHSIASANKSMADKSTEYLLNDLGIPGIRYLDGGSRSAGDGSYNYVVFDDKIPRILERNGIGLLNSLKR